jgi:nicotinate-nucleotide adenylyltransferase
VQVPRFVCFLHLAINFKSSIVELISKPYGGPRRLGILPGSFNPPTCAHLELGHAALSVVDTVLFVLPRHFPHKRYEGTTLEQRVEMLRLSLAGEIRFAIGISGGGLFMEIARECRALWPAAELDFLCGRDAAERIAGWDYGEHDAFSLQLEHFGLLVAPRGGEYCVPPQMVERVRHLTFSPRDEVSSTEVRRRVASGEPWEHLVPEPIRGLVGSAYSC